MTKIINVITDSNIGGAGMMLLALLKNADKSRFEHLVILPVNAKLTAEIEALGVRTIAAGGLAEKSFDARAVGELRKIFKREKPGIVHTHAAMSARVAARLTKGTKIVCTRHSVFDVTKAQRALWRRAANRILNGVFADAIIAVSPAAVENLTRTGTARKKIRVVYNGVEKLDTLADNEKTEARARFGVSESDFVCVILARLTAVKGHEFVIKAAEKLSEFGEIKFLIAGTGEIEGNLKKMAEERGNVRFLGFVKDTRALLGIADVQLNASYGTEATSLALLEGMSLGLPAIVSDFGGNPFVIEDGVNGLVYAQKDAGALADLVLKIKNNRELKEKLSNGAFEKFDNFTAKNMARGIEGIYTEVYK